MFITYNDEHEIVATIIGPDESYGAVLDGEGKRWKFHTENVSVNPITDCICPDTLAVIKKQEMALYLNKASVKADGNSTVTIVGVPRGATVNITLGGVSYASDVVTDGHVEFSTTTAGAYTFLFTCARYLPKTITVTAQ